MLELERLNSLNYLLLLGAATCAAVSSGWLLHQMTSAKMFWIIILASVPLSPVGLALPWCCLKRREMTARPTLHIFSSIGLVLVVCGAFLILGPTLLDGEPLEVELDEQLLHSIMAVVGIGMTGSFANFLLYRFLTEQTGCLRQAGRRLLRIFITPPQAPLVICDDFAMAPNGMCMLCMDVLVLLSPESAEAPENARDLTGKGLLQFPCEHMFHGICADRWLERDSSCPECRLGISSIRNCTRFCLHGPGSKALVAAKSKQEVWEEPQPDSSEEQVEHPVAQAQPLPLRLLSGLPPGPDDEDARNTVESI
jgi:hypothetical protein